MYLIHNVFNPSISHAKLFLWEFDKECKKLFHCPGPQLNGQLSSSLGQTFYISIWKYLIARAASHADLGIACQSDQLLPVVILPCLSIVQARRSQGLLPSSPSPGPGIAQIGSKLCPLPEFPDHWAGCWTNKALCIQSSPFCQLYLQLSLVQEITTRGATPRAEEIHNKVRLSNLPTACVVATWRVFICRMDGFCYLLSAVQAMEGPVGFCMSPEGNTAGKRWVAVQITN